MTASKHNVTRRYLQALPRRLPCRPAALAVVALTITALSGCGGPAKTSLSAGPYAPIRQSDRNTTLAEEFADQGRVKMDSDPKEAERLLRAALNADLYHGPAHNNLGVLYLRQGMLYEAAGEFEWARKLMPGHPDPRLNLALTLERAGRIDDAIDACRTTLEVSPEHLQSMQALARLQLRFGRADERTDHYLAEIAMRGETEGWREWAQHQLTRAGPPYPCAAP